MLIYRKTLFKSHDISNYFALQSPLTVAESREPLVTTLNWARIPRLKLRLILTRTTHSTVSKSLCTYFVDKTPCSGAVASASILSELSSIPIAILTILSLFFLQLAMMVTNFYDPASAGLSDYNSHFNITLSKCSIEIQHKYFLRSRTQKDLTVKF